MFTNLCPWCRQQPFLTSIPHALVSAVPLKAPHQDWQDLSFAVSVRVSSTAVALPIPVSIYCCTTAVLCTAVQGSRVDSNGNQTGTYLCIGCGSAEDLAPVSSEPAIGCKASVFLQDCHDPTSRSAAVPGTRRTNDAPSSRAEKPRRSTELTVPSPCAMSWRLEITGDVGDWEGGVELPR